MSVLAESTLTFAAAARELPRCRGDRPINPSTLWRWFSAGIKWPGGACVHLEAVKCGRTWITSKDALTRFIDATTPRPAEAVVRTPPIRTSTQLLRQ
jgi:hypothetical protein